MRLFFVNTDAVSYSGESKHNDWIDRNVVLTGGNVKYMHDLARIPADARVLVYVNKLGVIAVGHIQTTDVQIVLPPETVYDSDLPE
jgi:putative restriction endonuclease